MYSTRKSHVSETAQVALHQEVNQATNRHVANWINEHEPRRSIAVREYRGWAIDLFLERDVYAKFLAMPDWLELSSEVDRLGFPSSIRSRPQKAFLGQYPFKF